MEADLTEFYSASRKSNGRDGDSFRGASTDEESSDSESVSSTDEEEPGASQDESTSKKESEESSDNGDELDEDPTGPIKKTKNGQAEEPNGKKDASVENQVDPTEESRAQPPANGRESISSFGTPSHEGSTEDENNLSAEISILDANYDELQALVFWLVRSQ